RGVHVRRGAPGAVERRRDDTGRKLLAARDQVIGSARRQLAQDAQARGEGLDLRERVLDRLDELVRARTGTEQGTDGPEMLGAERLYGRAGAVRPRWTAAAARSSSASVTPAIADNTKTMGAGRRARTMGTACAMAAPFASEAPPNLWISMGRAVRGMGGQETSA